MSSDYSVVSFLISTSSNNDVNDLSESPSTYLAYIGSSKLSSLFILVMVIGLWCFIFTPFKYETEQELDFLCD